MSLWGVILSLFQSTVVRGLRLPKDHIPGGINKCWQINCGAGLFSYVPGFGGNMLKAVLFILLGFFCSVPNFSVLLAFFFL